MVVVDAEEIVEVAANIFCSMHGSSNVQLLGILGEWWENTRQNGLLYLAGYGKVAFQ